MTDTLPDTPELDPSALTATAFGRARKGLDPAEVNQALGRAADALRVWELRDRQLRARVEELEQRVAESHELDEHRIATVLGEETARIVTAAKDAAAEIRTKAEEQAARLIRETDEAATASADALKAEATELRDDAARLRDQAASDADSLRAAAAADADALTADARQRHDELIAEAASVLDVRTREAEALAAGLVDRAAAELSAAELDAAGIRVAAEVAATEERDRAREDGRSMVAEAKALRERMLADLAERRKTARRQIEGARGGRDRIVEVLRAAGAEVAATIDGLEDIDDEIQRAADAAAILVDDDIDAVVAELEAELGEPAMDGPDAGEPDVVALADDAVRSGSDTEAVDDDGELEADVELVETTESVDVTESDGVIEVVETVETVEVTDSADGIEVVDTIDVVDVVASADGIEVVETIEVVDTLVSVDDDGVVTDVEIEVETSTERIEVLAEGESDDDEPLAEGEPLADVAPDHAVDSGDGADDAPPATSPVVSADEAEDTGDADGAEVADEPDGAGSATVIGMFAGSTSPATAPGAPGAIDPHDLDDDLDLDLDDDLDDAEDDEDGPVAVDADGAGATVHDLFARIRAEGLDDAEDADADDSDGDGGVPSDADATADVAADLTVEVDLVDDEAGGPLDLTASGPSSGAPVVGPDRSGDGTAGAGVAVATSEASIDELLDRRDRVLVPIEKQTSRALRRLASDEQNEVLDQLRRTKRGRPDLATVLADPAVTLERFTVALRADYDAAVQAGSEFWAEVAGVSADQLFDDDSHVAEALTRLVGEFLDVHRAHMERTFAEADEQGLDLSDLGDRVRASYRDWRSTSLAELAGDLVASGFAQGERLAAGPGTPWRWVVDNGGLPCADGEDNALAGPVACEEPFPTGDITPPAHPGCRCILLPAHR